MSWILAGLAAVALTTAPSTPLPELRGEELMAVLKNGGYTIIVRHARTDRQAPNKETPDYSPMLRSEQRNLSPEGEQDVVHMKQAFARFAIPVGEVLSSPLYRCRETAEAFGTPTAFPELRAFPTGPEAARLIRAAPSPGTNRVIVTHHFIIEAHVPGVQPGDVDESEAVVVRPAEDGSLAVVGRFELEDWTVLAGPDEAPAGGETRVAMGHGSGPLVAPVPDTPVGRIEAPATAAGRLAFRYIDAFNSGNVQVMRGFMESSMADVPGRSAESRLEVYQQLFARHGTLLVTQIRSSEENQVVLGVRSNAGAVLMTVSVSPSQPGRTSSIRLATLGNHTP